MKQQTKIKLCGLSRPEDIRCANLLLPEYIGFVFAPKSRRAVSPAAAAQLKAQLDGRIQAVGVFVDAPVEQVAALLNRGVIDLAQLHGAEDAAYLAALRARTAKPVIQAFRIRGAADLEQARRSQADFLLLDSGAGSGRCFDWAWTRGIGRPFFLAGGLCPGNAAEAVRRTRPYAVDVSSGIETDGRKDPEKMSAFVAAVRQLAMTE